VRALFVGPRYTLADVTEVAQSLDLDATSIGVWDATHLGYDPAIQANRIDGATAEEVLDRITRALDKHPEAIILGNFDISILPENVLSAITDAVRGGAGLVLAHPGAGCVPEALRELIEGGVDDGASAEVTRGIGAALTAEWTDGLSFVRAGRYEAGRLVVLDYPGGAPLTHFLLPALARPLQARPEYQDTYVSLVARAVRWAAGRDLDVKVVAVQYAAPATPTEEEIPPDLPEQYVQTMRDGAAAQVFRPFNVQLSTPWKRDLEVEVHVREPERRMHVDYARETIIKAGETKGLVQLAMGPGRYFVDVILRDGKGVVDWYTEVTDIEGWPDFSNLEFSKDALLPNDALDISFGVRPLFHVTRQCVAYARAVDPLDRIVSEAYVTAPTHGGQVGLRLTFADLIADIVTVDVFLGAGAGIPFTAWDEQRAAHESRKFYVRQNLVRDRFHVIADGCPAAEYNGRNALRVLRDLGVDVVHAPATTAARCFLAETGLAPLPELTRWTCPAAQDGVIRRPCLSDPSWMNAQRQQIRDGVVLFETGGSGCYSLGSGNALVSSEESVCQSETCLTRFREILEHRYGDLPSLNAAWQTDFHEWAQVHPTTLAEAAGSGRPAPWVSFRDAMDGVFADAHRQGREAVRDVDPHGRVGFCTEDNPRCYQGYSWWRLTSACDILGVPPDELVMEKVRSYCRPDACFGVRVYAQNGLEEWSPWRLALHQLPLLWLREPVGNAVTGTARAGLLPDDRPSPGLEALLREVRELRESGLDALLLKAKRALPKVAVLDSRVSRLLDLVEPVQPVEEPDTCSEQAFTRILRDLGYGFDFVSPEQVASGVLKDYRVLVLPTVRAMRDDEIEGVRAFYRAGNCLVADLLPATHDASGAARPWSPLAEVFGVRHVGAPATMPRANANVSDDWMDKPRTSASDFTAVAVDPSVSSGEAESHGAAGDVAVWLVGTRGPGLTVLANHSIPPYRKRGTGEEETRLRVLLATLLRQAGVEPDFALADPHDAPVCAEGFRFTFGDAAIIALLADADGGKVKTALRLNGNAFVYNMLTGMPVARPERTRAILEPGRPALFSELPYELSGFALEAPDRVQAGRRLRMYVSQKTKEGLAGNHLVRIGLVRLDGRELPHYAQVILCKGGFGEGFFPLAANEFPEDYRITARDLLTGRQSEVTVRVVSNL